MLDSAVKLFGGDVSLNDILDMEIEDFRDAVEMRAEQRRKSLERYNKTGEKDLYIETGDSNEVLMQMMAAMMGSQTDFRGHHPVKPNIQERKEPRDYLRQKEYLQNEVLRTDKK